MTHRLGILSITAFAFTTFAQAQTPAPLPDTYFNAAKTMGKPGTLNADGSYRINMPRVDVVFRNSSGMVVPPDLGLATYIAFSGAGDTALAVGDVAMLEGESDHVSEN
jgi:hypothetical protein